ncbi:MAG TPA: AsmA-like C-terminal region-containing protein [Nitrospiraceae bacterium]|nr:AsmA-like C-terminal region-containing protein [Nitrospiraceae bacterium]
MGLRFRTWIVIVLAILLFSAAILAFPFIYDPNSVKIFLLEQVEQQVGRKILVGNAQFELFPRIRLNLSQVVIHDVDPSRVLFTAERIELVMKAYSLLLRRQVVGKRLTIEQPRIELRRNHSGRWNVAAPADNRSPERQGMDNPLGLLMLVRETVLTHGHVRVIDEFRPDGDRAFDIKELDAMVVVAPNATHADVRLAGKLPSSSNQSAFTLTGRVKQHASPVKMTAEDTGRGDPALQFEGTAEIMHVDIRQVADFFGPRPVPERVHGSVNLRGHITFAPGMVGYDVVFSKMKADIEGLTITGQASLAGLMGAHPTMALTFSSSPVTLDELLTRFPVQWLHPQLQRTVIEQQIAGTVEVVTATVTGSAAPGPRLSLTGEFRVKQGRVLIGRDRTPAQDLSGTIFIEPDRLRVMELSGTYGMARITGGKALVSSLEADPWLDLEVSGEMTAAALLGVLSKSIKAPRFARVLGELYDIKGDSMISLRITGPVNTPDGIKIAGAEIMAQDVWFRSPLLTERVVDLNGRVIYTKTSVEFDRLAGRFGRSQFEIHGAVATKEPFVYQDLALRARADVSQLLRLAQVSLPPSVTLDGMSGLAATLSGPTEAPHLKGVLELREAEFLVPDMVRKPAGTATSLEFEGAFSRDSVLTVERLELVLPPFRLGGKGRIRLGGSNNMEASFVSGPVSLSGLPQGMTVGFMKDGIVEVSLDMKGKADDWRSWQVNGWVALTDGLIEAPRMEHTIGNLYLRLKVVRNGAEIKRLAFKIKDSDVRLSGAIKNWHRTPSINVEIESAQMDLDLLIPKGKRSPARDFLEVLADGSRLAAMVTIDRGFYKSLIFTDLSWRLSAKDGVLDIDRVSGDTEGGQISGRLVVQLPRLKPADAAANVRFTGIPFERMLQITSDQSRLMSGALSASGTMKGGEKDPLGFLHSLDGQVRFLVENGRIQKGTILPKIITILNLPTLLKGKVDLAKDGFPFDKIIGSFSVMNGVITEDKLIVDSPVMKMTAAGNYEILDDHLDAVVVASPLGSYSQFLKSIPLFGKLFAGERHGLDTALFEVKGPLKDPGVQYLPLRSFAKGLTGLAQLAFDMLKNTIMLPKEIVAPSDERVRTSDKVGILDRPEPRSP